jgi:hypothetical protein
VPCSRPSDTPEDSISNAAAPHSSATTTEPVATIRPTLSSRLVRLVRYICAATSATSSTTTSASANHGTEVAASCASPSRAESISYSSCAAGSSFARISPDASRRYAAPAGYPCRL